MFKHWSGQRKFQDIQQTQIWPYVDNILVMWTICIFSCTVKYSDQN